jgi:hypothetical protein
MRLPQWRQVLRQDVVAAELRQCQPRGLVSRRTARDQLAPTVIEVL